MDYYNVEIVVSRVGKFANILRWGIQEDNLNTENKYIVDLMLQEVAA